MKNGVPAPPQGTNSRRALYSIAGGRDTKETKMFQDVRLAGAQESLPQQAEVTIELLPVCFPGKGTQRHRCQRLPQLQSLHTALDAIFQPLTSMVKSMDVRTKSYTLQKTLFWLDIGQFLNCATYKL